MEPHTTPSRGKVFPDLPGKSVHHSTDEPELYGIENKGYPMRAHILVSMQSPLKTVIGPVKPFNSMKLHIRLSYFLWDALFGPQAEHPTPLAFSPLSLTLA